MFANHIPAKELVPVMCKELSSTMMMMINKHMIDMTDRYIDMIGSLIWLIDDRLIERQIDDRSIQLENGQKISTDISPKRTQRWQITTWKDVQRQSPLGNANSSHRDTPVHTYQKCYNSSDTTTRWRGCRETGSLRLCGWEWKMIQTLWKAASRFLSKLNTQLPHNPATVYSRTFSPEQRRLMSAHETAGMFTATLFAITPNWKPLTCPPAGEQSVQQWSIHSTEHNWQGKGVSHRHSRNVDRSPVECGKCQARKSTCHRAPHTVLSWEDTFTDTDDRSAVASSGLEVGRGCGGPCGASMFCVLATTAQSPAAGEARWGDMGCLSLAAHDHTCVCNQRKLKRLY